uniref:Transthyretin-like family protein n=1 Tax=Panagrellus redivivus TaxID=6233 RepID=A0A7E4UPP5_PANRE
MWSACLLVLIAFATVAEATHKCVWVRGVTRCNKDHSKHFNVEVRVYDKDGISLFQMIDPDDLMGVSFTEEDGTFQLDGCGDDFNWLPGVDNVPEPYIQIRHFCNSPKGETIQLPVFETFVPETHDIGILELDAVEVKPIDVNRKNKGVIVSETEIEGLETLPKDKELTPINPKFVKHEIKLSSHDETETTTEGLPIAIEEDNNTKTRVVETHPDDILLLDD